MVHCNVNPDRPVYEEAFRYVRTSLMISWISVLRAEALCDSEELHRKIRRDTLFFKLDQAYLNVCSSLWSILVFESTREMKRCQRKNVTFLNTWQSYCFGSMLSYVPPLVRSTRLSCFSGMFCRGDAHD